MSNPFDGLISQSLIDKYNNMLREVIRANLTPARLIYPKTKWVDCTNCVVDIYTNSPNPYLRGQSNNCSVCNGAGKIQVETTEDIQIAVIFDNSKFIDVVPNLVVTPGGTAQTICEIGKITMLKTCEYITFLTQYEAYNKYSYTRLSEPVPCGLGNNPQFIITQWKIIG